MAHLAAGFTDQTNVAFWLVNEDKGPREDEREVMGCVRLVRLCRATPCHSLSLHCIDVSGSLPTNGVEGTVRIAKIDGAADYYRRTIERSLEIQPPLLFTAV